MTRGFTLLRTGKKWNPGCKTSGLLIGDRAGGRTDRPFLMKLTQKPFTVSYYNAPMWILMRMNMY